MCPDQVTPDPTDETEDEVRTRTSTMAVEVVTIRVVEKINVPGIAAAAPGTSAAPGTTHYHQLAKYQVPIAGGNASRRRQLAGAVRAAVMRHGCGDGGELSYKITREMLEEI